MTASKLLILDDDELTGQTIRNVAEFAGMQVVVSTLPSDFFEHLAHWQPTHIALDLVMPEMDGVQILAQLGEMAITAKIIITSGVGQQVLQAAARSAAAHGLNIIGILPKPFNPRAFRELVDITSSESHLLLEPQQNQHKSVPALSVNDLVMAIEQRQITIALQPKIECSSAALVGFEVLARWDHPQFGTIAPDHFISFAEHNQLIDSLTQLIFSQALPWFKGFLTQYQRDTSQRAQPLLCSLNISALSLQNLSLFNQLEALCIAHEITPEHFMLELTETGAMEDPVASLDILTRLRMKGFQLSIDDFGTGFSSMLQLVRMPFCEVKIDKSFVMTVQESRESRLVIKAIIDLAHSLGMLVIAEGIEDQSTLDFLQQLGCDKAQGFFIGKPMRAELIEDWLAKRHLHIEQQRLHKLHALNILDTPAENRYDRITRLARRLFKVPISLVSFIDEDRQWFKSKCGLDVNQTLRQHAFCNHTIEHDEPFIVSDATQDPLFVNNPLVTGMPFIRFYAGFPLKAPTGERLGSLCIIDDKPRFFSDQDRALLIELGNMVEEEIATNQLLAEDHLTGLLNRRGFESRAEPFLQLCLSQQLSASLIYFDLNNFKAINDSQGHQAGDAALQEFATLLTDTFRDSDLLSRVGGDEFVVLMINQTTSDIRQVMDRLKSAIKRYNDSVGEDIKLSFSYGFAIAETPQDFELQQLYMLADEAMYQSKRQ